MAVLFVLSAMSACSQDGTTGQGNVDTEVSAERELISAEALDEFKPAKGWSIVGGVTAVDGKTEFDLTPYQPGATPILVNGNVKQPHPYLFTKQEYQDVSVSMELMVPFDSNSGVYFMGRYEVQIRDSFGKPQVSFGDLGGIYQRWRNQKEAGKPQGYEGVGPSINASKAPGQWQTLDIVFQAPRFDSGGKKTQNARFVSVHVNGQQVQQNVEVTGPTRAAPRSGEAASGAIAIQGDHGPVAIRRFKVTRNGHVND